MSGELIHFIILLFGIAVAYSIGVHVGAETERRRQARTEVIVERIRSYARQNKDAA